MNIPWSTKHARTAGFSYVEIIIVSAIMLIVFGSLLAAFEYASKLGVSNRAKLSAQSLANERMEFFRSLPYAEVGVVSGFPNGTIPQTSSLSLNNISFSERVRVDYVDDPADGLLLSDTNGITQDYKQIRLEYTWTIGDISGEHVLVSTIVPRSIETNVGGGTARINVLDHTNTLLTGASVRLFNTANGYEVINPSGVDGTALFSAPADAGYELEVTANIAGNQYSTSSTHMVDAFNVAPTLAPFAINEADISTVTVTIGELSDLTIRTYSDITEDSLIEAFDSTDDIATSTEVAVTAGDLVLSDTLGVYESLGVAYLDPIVPTTIAAWSTVRVAAYIPPNTDYAVRFYTGSSTGYTLIPDAELPGNSVGFTDTLIDISELNPVTYPTTTIGVFLGTTDTSLTPEVDEVAVYWKESDVPLVSESFSFRGNKTIGAQTDGSAIYKASTTVSSDSAGEITFDAIEFDTYTLTPDASLVVASACPAHPHIQVAGVDAELSVVYETASIHTARIHVVDALGRSIPGALVEVDRSGYNEVQDTDTCGQAFFSGGGLSDNADYEIIVSAPGYTTEVLDPAVISGETFMIITLTS